MGFPFLILYLVVSFLYPAEIFPELASYHPALWTGVAGLIVSAFGLIFKPRFSFRCPQLYILFALMAVMAVSIVIADRWFGGALKVVDDFGASFIMFILVVLNVVSLRRLRITAVVVCLLAVVQVAEGYAALHYGFMPEALLAQQSEDDDDPDSAVEGKVEFLRIRGLGFMNDPNDLALGLATTLPFAALAWRPGRRARNLLLVAVPSAFLTFGVFLTRSRGGMLGVLAFLFFAMYWRWGRVRAALVTSAAGLLFMGMNFTGGRSMSAGEESAAQRLDAWAEGLLMFKSSPLFGVGFRNFTDHNLLTAHNSFVLCLAELGGIGYFLWLGLLVITLLQLYAIRRMAPAGEPGEPFRRWAQAMTHAAYVYIVCAFFLSRAYIPTLYLILGLAVAVVEIARRAGVRVELPSLPRLGRTIGAVELASIACLYFIVKTNGLWSK